MIQLKKYSNRYWKDHHKYRKPNPSHLSIDKKIRNTKKIAKLNLKNLIFLKHYKLDDFKRKIGDFRS